MNITKAIAEEVAIKLLKKRGERIHQLEIDLQKLVSDYYERTLPNEVKRLAETHSSFISWNNGIYLHGNGFNHAHFKLSKNLPVKVTSKVIQVDEKFANKVKALQNKIADLKKEYKMLKEDLKNAIFNMRTYVNCIKNFPEAGKILPVRQSTAVQIDLEKLRKAI